VINNETSHRRAQLETLLNVEERVNAGVERGHSGVVRLVGISPRIGREQKPEHRSRRGGRAGMSRRESWVGGISEQRRDGRIRQTRPKLEVGELGIPAGDGSVVLRDGAVDAAATDAARRVARPLLDFDFGRARSEWERVHGEAAARIAAWLPSLPEGVRRYVQAHAYQRLHASGEGPYGADAVDGVLAVLGGELAARH